MDIDRNRCVRAFEAMGMKEIDSLLGLYGQKGPFLELEEGKITPSEFRGQLRGRLPEHCTDAEMDAAFCEFLLGIPVARLRQLEQLHRRYPLYLLSNTNPIMMEQRIAGEFCKDGRDMGYYFNGIVTSYEAGCCKPERRIFDYAAGKFGIDPETTLFFDDSQANVDAAIRAGYQAVLVAPGQEFAQVLDRYLHS